jgi:hypothetical protein
LELIWELQPDPCDSGFANLKWESNPESHCQKLPNESNPESLGVGVVPPLVGTNLVSGISLQNTARGEKAKSLNRLVKAVEANTIATGKLEAPVAPARAARAVVPKSALRQDMNMEKLKYLLERYRVPEDKADDIIAAEAKTPMGVNVEKLERLLKLRSDPK